ncbi:MAG: Hsp20/alpha crystallin family protein [Rhodothermales bacterium]|nr:Hsp20/alpha crystallin family protein [Rhodothermales bacterium]
MNRVIHFTPVSRRPSLQREVDRLINRAAGPAIHGENGAPTWAPRLDIVETTEGFILEVDLPGLTHEQVEITFEKGILALSGERATPRGETDKPVRGERWAGRFARTVEFTTEVDPSGIKAAMRDGVLRIEVPKAESSKPVRIAVS